MSWKNAEAASEFMKRLANPNRRLSGLWTAPRRIEDNVRSWQIVLQNSQNDVRPNFRKTSKQAATVDRCSLKRATEVGSEFVTE
jgi:hypothetical protein